MGENNFITWRKNNDSEILQASKEAQNTFKYFWYQVALDFNRIVPALQLACVKALFFEDSSEPNSQIEHMWVDRINFDGVSITGVLINSPHYLTSVKEGDEVAFSLDRLDDWLCMLCEEIYGGYTIQVIRSRMDDRERQQYDEAWSLPFPQPDIVLVPECDRVFETKIAHMLAEHIKQEPKTTKIIADDGRSLLHLESLYGKTECVKVLLEHGVSPMAECDRGWTPLDYARVLEWSDIVALLEEKVE